MASAVLVAFVSLVSILQVGDWATVLTPDDPIFHMYHCYGEARGFHATCSPGP